VASSSANVRHDSRRYLGLELSGAKNHKTVLAALEYYPKEKKIFLLDLYERIAPRNAEESADEALLELIDELKDGVARIGVNVPLQLPPCIECTKACGGQAHCKSPAVRWMREATKKAARIRDKSIRVLPFTPYTQRPVELWVRYQVMTKLPETSRFEIDETLGGNRAPLAARMHYLKRPLEKQFELVEVWPKLTVAILAEELGLNKKVIAGYRHLEQGIHAREVIIDALAERHGIFVYERDIRKLAQNLGSFDAFICAYTALLADTQRTVKAPSGFPASSGWVHYPQV
jgi:hypothetical protein